MARANNEDYIVIRKRIPIASDDYNFAAIPNTETIPAAWYIVATYNPDGTEYCA